MNVETIGERTEASGGASGSEGRTPQGRQCPECGHVVAVHARYVDWCAECDWNVDPGAPDPDRGRIATVRRRLARAHGEQLAAGIGRGEDGPAALDTPTVLAYGISVVVHAVTAALVVVAGVLVIDGWHTGIQPVLGVLVLVIAAALLPRPGRLPKHAPVLYRADAPRLFELIDEVGAAVGTSGVHAVVVEPVANAGVTTYGFRNRRVMYLGLGLWEILSPQELVALLGHELGHFANGDVRSSYLTGWALHALQRWHHLLTPTPLPPLAPLWHQAADLLLRVLAFLPRWAVYGVTHLLDGLTMRASQRAEYRADTGAARVGSTEAAVALMDRMLLCEAVQPQLRRESVAAQMRGGAQGRALRDAAERGLWERLGERMGSVPESEYERLRRVSARRGHSVDDTHPPTHLRRRCLASAGAHPARVVCDAARTEAVAAELAPVRAELARRVIRDYAH
ncbi:M48 family metallopeptidase [Streptomyces sp. ISL-66]|uniref:M48 family metallopeptidase n=1 Tax=Streptomyces sp. ISL-66 TaxID=2819186 RepID=UPI0027E3DFFD|nr:M48 family metallopeptidase [Streptomyces sp. ISL-66]